jgi:hypothetical protein
MRRLTVALLAAGTTAMAAAPAAHAADAIYGVTSTNHLVLTTSDAPGAPVFDLPLRGLGADERVLGLDVRPNDDTLFAVTNANRAVQVNPVTGAVRPAFGPFAPALAGTSYGVDVNPVANALRIVSDAEQNLRVSAANVTTADTNLAYAPGDPGAGTNPSVAAVGYTSAVPGATNLYGIDSARDAVVRIEAPNTGVMTTVGPLGVDAAEPVGFDIAQGGGAGYASLKVGTAPAALYRVDLTSGRATPLRADTPLALPQAAGTLVDIAVAGSVPDDTTRPELSVAFSSTILEENTNTLEPSISCDETCTVTVEAQVQGRDAGEGTATILGAGRATVRVPLSSAARARIARRGTELISLDITATDAAGNRTTQNNRVSRTQTLGARRG